MAEEINAQWQVLKKFAHLHDDDWDHETAMLLDAVDELSESNLLQPLTGENRQAVSCRNTFTAAYRNPFQSGTEIR